MVHFIHSELRRGSITVRDGLPGFSPRVGTADLQRLQAGVLITFLFAHVGDHCEDLLNRGAALLETSESLPLLPEDI